tara:strand:- start:2930 stop:3817 length:888 start_codon:yes stop_codon:yes gene_type:complete
MPKKSNLEKAAEDIGEFHSSGDCPEMESRYFETPPAGWVVVDHPVARFWFVESSGKLVGRLPPYSPGEELVGPSSDASVGVMKEFMTEAMLNFNYARRPGVLPPPPSLGGNGKDLETVMMKEAARLKNRGVLTMGRYGVMVSLIQGEWRPVPSLPDFEGVFSDGRQFIIEAKVCSQASFRMQKAKIKHKQVRHMIERSEFGVACYVMLHFNARLGKTFYDPAFTALIPVKSAEKGGWEVWEQYAAEKDKDKEFTAIDRAMARALGQVVDWRIPPRCKNAAPDLETALAPFVYSGS